MSNKISNSVQTIEELSKGKLSIKDSFKNDPEWLKKLRSSAWDLFLKVPVEADPNMLKFLQPGKIERLKINYSLQIHQEFCKFPQLFLQILSFFVYL